MKATPLGGILWGVGWLAIGLAIILGTIVPAVAGVTLLGLLEAARRRTAATPVRADRDVPDRVRFDGAFAVQVRARAPDGVALRIDDPVPTGLVLEKRRGPSGRGQATEDLVLRPAAIGASTWTHTTVHLQDPWGTHETPRRVPLASEVQVLPEQALASTGRRIGRRNTVKAVVPGRFGMETVPEVETVRPYMAGDRLRDIDWPRTTRFQDLISKERERVIARPVIVLLDAGPSMRWQRRTAKLTTSARLALAVLSAAQAAGVATHLYILGEDRLAGASSALTGRAATQALRDLQHIAAPLPVTDLPWPEEAVGGDGKDFLRASGAASTDPFGAALRTLQRLPDALVVAILDGETHPGHTERMTRRLAAGRRAVLVLPATGSHQVRRGEAKGVLLERLKEAHRRRLRIASRLAAYRVPTLSLHPDNMEEVLSEVVRWAR